MTDDIYDSGDYSALLADLQVRSLQHGARRLNLLNAEALRRAARALFEDRTLDLDQRDASWVDADSYDAGVVAAAKAILQIADQYEANLRAQP